MEETGSKTDGLYPNHGEAKLIAVGQGSLVVSCYMLCWQESGDARPSRWDNQWLSPLRSSSVHI